MRAPRSRWLGMVALLLVGCGNESGYSRPTPPDCGQGVPAGSESDLLRWPYVQSVTTTGAVVAWGMSAAVDVSTIEYGTGRDLGSRREAQAREIPAGEKSMALYSAHLGGLSPDTYYCYRVLNGEREVAAGLRFRTAPADPEATVTFFAIGDFGGGTKDQERIRDRMLERAGDADLVFTTGDNAYTKGTHDQFQRFVFEVYQELMTGLPFFPTPGNHDYGTDLAQPYLDNFFLPENAWREHDRERYYSMEWGPIHYVALDSEMSLLETAEEAEDDMQHWLEADLRDTRQPWKIVALHQPPYSSHPSREPNPLLGLKLVPLFERYGVQLVLAGHDHFYERSHPILGGKRAGVEEGGVTYVVTGGGGMSLYDVEIGTNPLQAAAAKAYHFVIGRVEGSELTLRAVDREGVEIDRVLIER
ncbi:MAG: metallophosphoesterase family protein [Nitrospirae bacterium]|nr:metallophosphoesterase family protein [Nitrospirota bacterium]